MKELLSEIAYNIVNYKLLKSARVIDFTTIDSGAKITLESNKDDSWYYVLIYGSGIRVYTEDYIELYAYRTVTIEG